MSANVSRECLAPEMMRALPPLLAHAECLTILGAVDLYEFQEVLKMRLASLATLATDLSSA